MKLGKISNTRLEVGDSFLFLIAFISFNYLFHWENKVAALVQAVTTIALVVFIILSHEMGHIKTAEKVKLAQGETVLKLWALGGVAQIPSLNTASPKQEFWTAIGGPAVNVVYALLSLPLLWLAGTHSVSDIFLQYSTDKSYLQFLVNYFFTLNIVVGVFNMLPGLPMDGGRVLRSVLAMRMSRLSATTIATYVAWGTAAFMAIFGVYVHSLMMVLISGFVSLGAWSELRTARKKAAAELLGYEVIEEDKLL